jgi:acetyl-CoA carboxylase biotin carboxyl carrier protein
MEVREIKTLIALMREHGLIELEIEDKKGKVRLVRGANPAPGLSQAAGASQVHPQAHPDDRTPTRRVPARAPARMLSAAGDGSGGPALADNQRLITSPMVGTFYRATAPDADPFVEEGDSVRKGQPLCIIEAMKMMNEIECEVAGRVVKILSENAQPVEYGQPLMVVEIG